MSPQSFKKTVKIILMVFNMPVLHVTIITAVLIKTSIKNQLVPEEMWMIFLNTLPVFISFILLSFVIRILTDSSFKNELFKGKKTSFPESPLTEADLNRISIHEAGHVIGLALFHEIPTSISAKVNVYKSSTSTSNGLLSFDSSLKTKSDMEACMKMLLASSCAEEVLLKQNFIGSESDHDQFEFVARKYLHLFSGIDNEVSYPWFRHPINEMEVTVNGQSLNRLMTDLYSQTLTFVRNNENLVLQVAHELKSNPKNEIKEDKVKEILERVVIE